MAGQGNSAPCALEGAIMKKGQQLPRDAKGKLRRKVAGEPWPCPRCGVEKPLTVEYWKPSATDSGGLYGYCRTCTGSRRPPSCLAVNGMKHCNGLTHPEGGADLPVEAFGPHATTPDKLQGHCRASQAAYRKTPKGRASSQKGSKKWIAKPENRVKSRASTERWRRFASRPREGKARAVCSRLQRETASLWSS